MTTDTSVTAATTAATGDEDDLERLVRNGLVETLFSPVVDLFTDEVAGFRVDHVNREVPFSGPEAVRGFRRALRASATVGDLDASLRDLALRSAEALGLDEAKARLFLTTEPQSLVALEDRTDEPDRSIILQLDPAAVAQAPATVLRTVRQARALGWGIGMKSIGKDVSTTAFLPLINPSVVALHSAVMDQHDPDTLAELVRVLHAHVERTGAVVLAEGVRDEDDLARAQALGARLATGPLFGYADPHPGAPELPREDVLVDHHTRNLAVQGTPYTISKGLKRDPLVMDLDLMRASLRDLLARAEDTGESIITIGVFGEEETLPPGIVDRFRRLRDRIGFTAVFSGAWESSPVEGVRSGALDASDPLREEYGVIVVGPDWSGMVSAARRVDLGPDGRTEYDVYVTTERYTVVDAARAVLTRISN